MAHILVIEDEADIRELTVLHLRRAGHEPVGFGSVEEVSEASLSSAALLVLDWMLPGCSGLDFARNLMGRIPILMVTARTAPEDIVAGLEAGADDYVTKPFEIPVLLARVEALLRRQRRQSSSPVAPAGEDSPIAWGDVQINPLRHEVRVGREVISLTPNEFKLLVALVRNTGRVMTRQSLINLIQGENVVVVERTVDTHVFALRKKLGDHGNRIETIRGVGYRVEPA